MTTTAHLSQIYTLLVASYGEPQWLPDYDPLGGLVGTILSQHTSDINSERAYQQLIETFPTWEQVRDAPTDEVAYTIRSGGLANIKAARIQTALAILAEQQHTQNQRGALKDYLYQELARRSPEDGWRYLRAIPGIGPKTAACVLMFNMGMPVMPVDTHVHRVSRRLGLIGANVNAEQAHEIFARITPSEWVYTLHVHLIRHGRQVCHAQRPACAQCTLYRECAYIQDTTI